MTTWQYEVTTAALLVALVAVLAVRTALAERAAALGQLLDDRTGAISAAFDNRADAFAGVLAERDAALGRLLDDRTAALSRTIEARGSTLATLVEELGPAFAARADPRAVPKRPTHSLARPRGRRRPNASGGLRCSSCRRRGGRPAAVSSAADPNR